MSPPGHKKNRILQVDVTDRCSLACSNCTRHLAHHGQRYDISVEVFRLACRILNRALPDFVIGCFGGEPTLHPRFPELCIAMQQEIPDVRRRGLWTSRLHKHGQIAAATFTGGYLNLNGHNVPEAEAEFDRWFPGRMINESRVGGHKANHAALLTAIKDFVGTPQVPDENAMWRMIMSCDYDREWSGCVIERDAKPMLYSCEIHAGFDLMYGENNGVELTDESAVAGINTFAHQYQRWCPSCGGGLRLVGHQDAAETDDVSKTHLPLVQLKVRRKLAVHESLDAAPRCEQSTDYERRRTAERVGA